MNPRFKTEEYFIRDFKGVVVTVESPDYYHDTITTNVKDVLRVYMIGKGKIKDYDLDAFFVDRESLNSKTANEKIKFAMSIANKTKLEFIICDSVYKYVPNFKLNNQPKKE